MNKSEQTHYNEKFYDYTFEKSYGAARKITRIICDMFQPQSVCDVGCGEAVWLAAYKEQGVAHIQGLDGAYVETSRLKIPQDCFKACDLSRPFDLPQTYDVVQSLEVAEHLPTAASASFVQTLTKSSSIVVFSAAVPGQGGMYHINEQPLEFWRGLFRAQGYSAYDMVRPQISADKKIAPWYRFNLLVYVSDNAPQHVLAKIAAYKIPEGTPIADFSPLWYTARKKMIATLPFSVQQRLAKLVS